MNKKTNVILVRFLQSFVVLPFMTGALALNPVLHFGQVIGINQNPKTATELAQDDSIIKAQALLKEKGEKIDAYFTAKNMPLAGYGKTMAEAAEKNGLDWRLVAAISVIESTGGRNTCQRVANNDFGWGSCTIGFDSREEAIRAIAAHLGGNMDSTRHYYKGKTTVGILETYNPPNVVPDYAHKVIRVMNSISPLEIG